MNGIKIALLAGLLAMGLYGTVSAQMTTGGWGKNTYYTEGRMMTADMLLNQHVYIGNEDIGEVERVIIDPKSGKIVALLISYGGFFEFGEDLITVPWKAVKFEPQLRGLRLNLDKAKLENAPRVGYEGIYDRGVIERSYDFWGFDTDW